MKRHRGVTLLEVLTVCAVLAALAAIAYPILAQVKERARQTGCESNLRQIGVALQVYRSDYGGDGRYGDPIEMGLPLSYDAANRHAMLPAKEVWICPRYPEAAMSYYLFYTYHPDTRRWDDFRRFSLEYESRTPLLYDPKHTDQRHIYSPFYPNRMIGLLESGQVVNRVRTGDWLHPRWWNDER
ncbi:MAG TPA: prepilin-type N-terminal cleavage/methylation domain-containing protein [Fimbriimonadaceae bacterium]|nr:prepilin-type N-terminal cleavage/methylation domain-containing protein [Fimbriimonadaceae bacterium]